LAQIAWDGSQKLQMRLLPIIRDNIKLNRSTDLLCFSLASWFEFICQALKNNKEIFDPMADTFNATIDMWSDDVSEVVDSFLSIESIFGEDLINNLIIKEQLINSLTKIRNCPKKQLSSLIESL
jgi:fructuronate reductase